MPVLVTGKPVLIATAAVDGKEINGKLLTVSTVVGSLRGIETETKRDGVDEVDVSVVVAESAKSGTGEQFCSWVLRFTLYTVSEEGYGVRVGFLPYQCNNLGGDHTHKGANVLEGTGTGNATAVAEFDSLPELYEAVDVVVEK